MPDEPIDPAKARAQDDLNNIRVPLRHNMTVPLAGARTDWLIAGCESGPGARPCSVEWLRSLRDQCAAAGVPYFLKQAVEHVILERGPEDNDERAVIACGTGSKPKGYGYGGPVIERPYLDGVQHIDFPREVP